MAVNPALIPLLRGTSSFSQPVRVTGDPDRILAESLFTEDSFAEDAGNPARGILIGLLLSMPIWGLIVMAIYWIAG